MRNATSKFTYILRTLSFTFSKSKGSSLLSRLAKNFPVNIVAVITCGVVDIDYEVMAEAQKRQRQQRAKEVKRLDFPFLVITRKQEKRRHILDDFELDYEIEAAEGQEMKLQYTDAFREGNVLFGEAFEGYDSNPDSPDGIYYHALACNPDGPYDLLNARRLECTIEEWVECGRACEEFMPGEDH